MEALDKALVTACWIGNLDEVKKALTAGANPNARTTNINKKPAILEAVYHYHPVSYFITQLLLTYGVDVNATVIMSDLNEPGENALYRCVQSGQTSMVKLLIENKANPYYDYYGSLFTYALDQFIYYLRYLHCDQIHPCDYAINPERYQYTHPKRKCYISGNHYNFHTKSNINYGQVVWYLLFKFLQAFKENEKAYLLSFTKNCAICKKYHDDICS